MVPTRQPDAIPAARADYPVPGAPYDGPQQPRPDPTTRTMT